MKASTTSVPMRPRCLLRAVVTLMTSLFAALVLIGTTSTAAHAHAELVGSSPAPGTTDRPVREVRLSFSEPLAEGLSQVAVTGPRGSVTAGDPVIVGNDVVAPLQPLTKAGTYRVAYRVVAADGHAEVGGLDVVVTPASAAAAAKPVANATNPSSGPEGAGSAARGSRTEAPEQPLPVSSGASVAKGGLDLAVTVGGAVGLVLLFGLYLLLRRGAAPAGRTS